MYSYYSHVVAHIDRFAFAYSGVRSSVVAKKTNSLEACAMTYGSYAATVALCGLPFLGKRLMEESKHYFANLHQQRLEVETYQSGVYCYVKGGDVPPAVEFA